MEIKPRLFYPGVKKSRSTRPLMSYVVVITFSIEILIHSYNEMLYIFTGHAEKTPNNLSRGRIDAFINPPVIQNRENNLYERK